MSSGRRHKAQTKKARSSAPIRTGRSPTRSGDIEKNYPLRPIRNPGETELIEEEYIVSASDSSLAGINAHPNILKSKQLFAGSLVIVTPSIIHDQTKTTMLMIIASICIAPELAKSTVQLDRWQRESLAVPLGSYVRIHPYKPSFTPIALSYIRPSQEKTFLQMHESFSLYIKPLDTAESLTVTSIGEKPLSNSLHTLILSSLLTRKFINENTFIIVSYFGQSYSFRITAIRGPKTSTKQYAHIPEDSPTLQGFVVTPKTAIRVQTEETHSITRVKPLPVVIGGLEAQIDYIEGQIKLCLYEWKEFKKYKLKAPRGILLFGPPGTGKTLMVRVLAERLKCSLFIINGPEIMGKVHGESEGRLREIFDQAKRQQPSLIFIDEIDAICSKRENLESEFEKRIVAQLLSSLDQLHDDDSISDSLDKEASVVVLAATNRPDSLDKALRRPGRFDREIEIGIPNPEQRREIINVYMNSVTHSLTEEDLHYFASSTHGYVGADLAAMCREACIHSLLRTRVISEVEPSSLVRDRESSTLEANQQHVLVTTEDMKRAMSKIRPSAMRELMIEVPHISWNDIGGNEDIKQNLKEAVEWPLRYPEAFERMGIRPPRGILLYGPPGCSKTMMAKALATEAGLNFIAVKGPELFSKWVGESERAIRELFRKARAAAPSIVFFDEIDALAITRGGSDAGGVADRVLSQLLTELDGVEPLKKVTVVAATNRPDIIDKALLRPGRIDRIVYVGLPDHKAREHIIRMHLSKISSNNIDIEYLIRRTKGYSGAEVVAVCRESSMFALTEDIDIEAVSMAHFEQALNKVKPRISESMLAFYAKFQNIMKT